MKNIENIVIDIGSNTLKVAIFNKNLQKIKSFNYVVSLALDTQDENISQKAIQRLFDALDKVNANYKLKGAKCVATAIFRKSKNAHQIAKDIYDKYGFVVNIINAKLEARLTQKAVSLYGFENALIVDIGGASTEFIQNLTSVSFDFGIVSFYKDFMQTMLKKLKLTKQEQKTLKKILPKKICKNDKIALNLAIKQTQKVKQYLQNINFKSIILCSKICIYNKSMQEKIPYSLINEDDYIGRKITKKELINGARKLARMNENKAKFYVGDDRKMFLVFGVFLLIAMFEKQKSFICFDDALKYGLLHTKLDDEFYKNCIKPI